MDSQLDRAKQLRSVERYCRVVWTLQLGVVLMFGGLGGKVRAQTDSGDGDLDLRELTFEELLDVQVTSVSKKSESVSASAAAITVVTQEDIRRSGAASLAEAIRLAPGMQVAAIDAANWAISARGFNDVFANKLLVMIDGRPIYTPLFSGVPWDANDVMMEDVDRIEIVRGPGATLWGANAVNGVINVITRSADETQGMLAYGMVGTELLGNAGFRYGFQLGDNLYMRVYGKYQERDSFVLPDGTNSADSYYLGQGGFRLDWYPSAQNQLTFQGDLYGGSSTFLADSFPLAAPYTGTIVRQPDIDGGNLLARWLHYFSESSPLTVQTFFDRTERLSSFQGEQRSTFDIDVQQGFEIGESWDFVVGGNYRRSSDSLFGPFGLPLLPTPDGFTPRRDVLELRSGFVQAGWDILEDKLNLTFGSKFEDNDYTGMEVQPSVRLRWHPKDNHTFWTSISRAVRIPSRAEQAIQFTQYQPDILGAVSFMGSGAFEAENLIAYELGYRVKQSDRLWWDVSAFYNDYTDLQTREVAFPDFSIVPPLIPVTADNLMEGYSVGAEVSANWQVNDWWRLRPAYSLLRINIEKDPASTDFSSQEVEGTAPKHSASLWSYMNWGPKVEFDVGLRFVDQLSSLGVPAYTVADVRLGWAVTDHVNLSIGGKNLFNDQHPEYAPTLFFLQNTEVQHSAYVKMVVTF